MDDPKQVTELQFQQHCKEHDHCLSVANSNQFFDVNNKLIGITFCDNANPENSTFYVY